MSVRGKALERDLKKLEEDNNKIENKNEDDLASTSSHQEGKVKKLPYPKSIGFIISNEFCERFMYYGIRAILVLYLTRKLDYYDDEATIIFHVFSMMVYFMCVFGAILSDSWLGKFKTIIWLSVVYAIGSLVLSLGAIPTLYLPARVMTLLGLAFIAIGSGGIKPCVAAFGGDQFRIPEQAYQMTTFFSIFYFSINCGSLISSTVTPILRHDVRCFEDDDCFPLAFGVPGALMVISIVIFLSGKFLYIIKPPSGNMLFVVSKCISNALSVKFRRQKTVSKKEHWLDYAEEKHGKQRVNETKILLKVLLLYVPLPVFWALFDQQGSRWTFQATRMNGDIGLFEVKPDQMLVLSSLLILLFIPLYDVLFYPLLAKIRINRPLQKLTLGGILAGISFILSGVVELELEKTYPILPASNECQLRIFNTFSCNYTIKSDIPNYEEIILPSLHSFEAKHINVMDKQLFSYEFISGDDISCPTFTGFFNLTSQKSISYFAQQNIIQEYVDDPRKSRTGDPILRILVNHNRERIISVIDANHKNRLERYTGKTTDIDLIDLISSTYEIWIDSKKVTEIKLAQGHVVTMLMLEQDNDQFKVDWFEIASANSLSMLWLIPQYVVMALGEVMFSVTGLQFSYSQAPDSMKSVLQACWQLTVAFGNVIDVIVVGANAFDSQANEFFLFAGIMFVDMILFIGLAYRYKPVERLE